MTTTYLLRSVGDAVDVGVSLTMRWFRGHSRDVGVLTPRIFRPEYDDGILRELRPDLEINFIEDFKRNAGPLSTEGGPDDDDHLSWLYLMQHHRTPTRLLDWTENVLVALFFVVTEDLESDGELWAMHPWLLNEKSHVGRALPMVGRNPVLRFLVEEPYWAGSPEELALECGTHPTVPDRPVAFRPKRDFRRMVSQLSTFTIHPRPTDGNMIPEILMDEKELVRYIVPAAAKRTIRNNLRALGITEDAVFPDLEGLSRALTKGGEITIAHGLSSPPVCGGPVIPESSETADE